MLNSAVHVLLFRFYPDFIMILSWFYLDFILILCILILSWFYQNKIWIKGNEQHNSEPFAKDTENAIYHESLKKIHSFYKLNHYILKFQAVMFCLQFYKFAILLEQFQLSLSTKEYLPTYLVPDYLIRRAVSTLG